MFLEWSQLVILATEVGDKTFFIAAVLAMRNGRLVVYLGAMGNQPGYIFLSACSCSRSCASLSVSAGALAVMHVLSCLMGYTLPALLPRAYTHFLGAVLFAYFGFKLLYDAREVPLFMCLLQFCW